MKNPYQKINQRGLSLGDLIAAISASTKNERETVAAVRDMFATGRVKISNHGHRKLVRFCL